jgi:hypothetical protein
VKEPDSIAFVIDDEALARDGIQSLIRSIGVRTRESVIAKHALNILDCSDSCVTHGED